MGHATEAALLATLTVGSLRNGRRALASPAEQADTANASLLALARTDQFVTGQLIRIRLDDGTAELVNAGHPQPYLVRDGHPQPYLVRDGRPVALDLATDLPLGVQARPYTAQTLQLRPGDRLLLVTDGYLERSAVRVDIDGILASTLDRHPR